MTEKADNAILTVTGLKTWFPVRRGLFSRVCGHVKAVDGVDLTVRRGKTLALVGESGSGKTTVGRTILRLIQASAGQVNFDGQDVLAMGRGELRQMRERMQAIFQDPFSSLNPRMTVGQIVGEPMAVHKLVGRRQRKHDVAKLLDRVGLSGEYVNRYPHEFSGGQRQRIGIARALSCKPDFIVCDEPVSALDVSIQAQILNLLSDLQAEMGLSYLFIAHNLAVVEHFADEIAVMYLGRIIEVASKAELLGSDSTSPRLMHPYTEALISAVPQPQPQRKRTHVPLPGEMPSPINPPSGCPFHPRCPMTRKLAADLPDGEVHTILSAGENVRVVRRCVLEQPTLKPTANSPSHLHACTLRQ